MSNNSDFEFRPSQIKTSNMSNLKARWIDPKPDELKMAFRKFEGEYDMVFGNGSECCRSDRSLLNFHTCSPRLELNLKSTLPKFGKSLIQELFDRGYDLSTLKFSIKKLKPCRVKVEEGDS